MAKSGEKWGKVRKVAKSCEKCLRVVKSGKNWGKVSKSGEK